MGQGGEGGSLQTTELGESVILPGENEANQWGWWVRPKLRTHIPLLAGAV